MIDMMSKKVSIMLLGLTFVLCAAVSVSADEKVIPRDNPIQDVATVTTSINGDEGKSNDPIVEEVVISGNPDGTIGITESLEESSDRLENVNVIVGLLGITGIIALLGILKIWNT